MSTAVTYTLLQLCIQDECSFVSLRDIERAMIVLEWFHKVLDFIEKDASYINSKTVRMLSLK